MNLFCRQIDSTEKGSTQKPDLIFLHGTGSNSHMWDKQADHFSKLGYRCLLIDLRGHGGSPEPHEPANFETYKADVMETLATIAPNYPAYFIGHSLGALISVALAEEHPEMFAGIFAASYPSNVATPLHLTLRAATRGPMQLVKKSGISQHFAWRERTLFDMDPYTLDQLGILFRKENWLHHHFKAQCPIHFAVGRFDPVARCTQVISIQKRIPNSTLKIVEWSGHNFMDATPDDFNAWMTKYLLITDN